jgi:hypothetical protein
MEMVHKNLHLPLLEVAAKAVVVAVAMAAELETGTAVDFRPWTSKKPTTTSQSP